MQPYTDWIALWKELVENIPWHTHPATATGEAVDPWREKARIFDDHVKQRWSQGSDSSRDFVTAQVEGAESVLDIGAGTGAWACLLARHARRIRAKVNLIPCNTVQGLAWQRPPDTHCRAFRDVLLHAGVSATLRREKGHDIDAACGQLRLQQESREGLLP